MKEDQELFYEKIKQRWNDGLTFTSFNLQTEEIEEINLYLSRITHLILVCENRTGKTFLNLEKLSLEKFDYDHQLEYNLPHQQCTTSSTCRYPSAGTLRTTCHPPLSHRQAKERDI